MTEFRPDYWDGNPETTALLIIDLQRGYCDPESDMAQKLNWDVSQADQLCHDAVGFIDQVREHLPAHNIIWTRMSEAKGLRGYADNSPYAESEDFVELCVEHTRGHGFHVVRPESGEPDLLKFHPSSFSKASFLTFGHPKSRYNKFNLEQYLEYDGPVVFNKPDKQPIETVAAIGVIDSRCVNATLMGASERGFKCLTIDGLVGAPERKNLPSGVMSFNDEVLAHRQVRDMFIAAPISPEQFIDCLRNKRPFTP
jgi:nicotinamidase-related amidase